MTAIARKRVLVIDDDQLQRQLLERILNLLQLQVTSAESGQEGVEQISSQGFDLVLLDMQMPEMDGFETLAKFRELLGEKTPPIIGLSGSQINNWKTAGFTDYIVKPFSISELTTRLRPFVDIPA